MIRHHPSDAILIAMVSGRLPEAHRRVLATHLSMCPTCVARRRQMQEVGGALLDTIPPTPLADDALALTLRRLDDADYTPEIAALDGLVTLSTVTSGRWRWSGPGVGMMSLLKRDATASRLDLIRVGPGVGLLRHGHTGFETTIVLQGAYDDGQDCYGVGDFAEVDTNVDHCPRALGSEDCICLIATTGQMRPRGWLGRVIRPLIGM
jgi:putative transcriptional regulator